MGVRFWMGSIILVAVGFSIGCRDENRVGKPSLPSASLPLQEADEIKAVTDEGPVSETMESSLTSDITDAERGAQPTSEKSFEDAEAEAVSVAEPTDVEESSAESLSVTAAHNGSDHLEPADNASTEVDSDTFGPAFRLLLPTTSGLMLVDAEILIGTTPLAEAFESRIQQVIEEAKDSSEWTWPQLFKHVASDREQFGRGASINSGQYRNLIRLFDQNRNKRPDDDEVRKFLYRNSKFPHSFRLVGSDHYREINRTQSPVFSAMDRDGNQRIEAEEIAVATDSLYQLDHNGDFRVDLSEVNRLLRDEEDSAWDNRRRGRWGQVAMELSGYVDWQMLAYNVGDVRRANESGPRRHLVAELDGDGDGTIDSEEARSLLSIKPDVRLRVAFPLLAGQKAQISVVPLSGEVATSERVADDQICMEETLVRLIARVSDLRAGPNQFPPEAFLALDANEDGGLDESEIPAQALRQYSFEELDQDEDGKLTLAEITEGMSPKSPIWNVQVRARGAESPDAVFSWLDANQDFVLSTREIEASVSRLSQIVTDEGWVTPHDIPDSYVLQFGRGDPDQEDQIFAVSSERRELGSMYQSWPRWARSMDTNGDGDISRQEFPGTREQFAEMDIDADGYIESNELPEAKATGE